MFISDHIISDFTIRFSDDFFYEEVLEKFKDYFDENNGMFRKPIDMFNAFVIGTDILGYSSPNTKEQGHHRGQTRTFQNSLDNTHKNTKTLDITFSLKSGLINYYMLYENILRFNSNLIDDGKDIFFPHIYLDVMDNNGNILYSYVYKEIQITSLSSISLKKTDSGIGSKEFSCSFKYNILDIRTYFNKKKSKSLSPEFEHKNLGR
jgi:hypothetical protein